MRLKSSVIWRGTDFYARPSCKNSFWTSRIFSKSHKRESASRN